MSLLSKLPRQKCQITPTVKANDRESDCEINRESQHNEHTTLLNYLQVLF